MNQNHLIQKVFVELTVSNKEKAQQIKDDINSFLSIDVFPEIEQYINTIEKQLAGHTLQISRLEMDLDVKTSSLNTELKNKIAELFKEKLSEIISSAEISDEKTDPRSKPSWVNHQEKMVQTFIFFLENGYMPWWNSDKNNMGLLETAVFESIISTPGFRQNIISILPGQHVQKRIIHQLSDRQIAQICFAILENENLKINPGFEKIYDLSDLDHHERVFLWHLVLQILTKRKDSSEDDLREYFLEQISNEVFKKKSSFEKRKALAQIFTFITEDEIAESISKREDHESMEIFKSHENIMKDSNGNIENSEKNYQDQEEFASDGISEDGQYVQNTGLILIHPFIKTFFEHCGLLNKETQELTDPELCAHLLHYVATGNTNAPEYEMIFEKFLCNIPMNQSINRHIKLSGKHKAQAKNVIESVQHNWSPMKKSSPALLQNEFFQRPGKLVVTDYDYTLTVERKTQDILLDKLNWGIGFVKLPWKEKFLLVNW